jgi:phage protein D
MPIEMGELIIQANATTNREIKVEGTKLAQDVDANIESVVVTDRLTMADTFVIVFRDPDKGILEKAGCQIGKRVTISTASTGEDAPAVLIDGEITSVEADYDNLGARAIARGYDYSHRLTAGRRSQVFKGEKFSDVARKVATAAGLEPDIDQSSGTHDHIIQANQSDYEFLKGLARQIDFDCRVEGKTLRFKKKTDAASGPAPGDYRSQKPVDLVWNDNLLEFRGRVSAVSQVADVAVRGWDVNEKKPVIGKAGATATNAAVKLKPDELAKRIGGQSMIVVDRPVGSQEAADALAAAKAEQVGSAAYEATFVALGSAKLKAGVAVSVSGVEDTLVGTWVVSSSRHEFGNGSYRTSLECTGRQDRSLHGVVANAQPGGVSADVQRIPGLVVAIVTNNLDPLDLGRVKLRYPWLDDNVESSWARVAAPGAGPNAGVTWLPEVNDEVLVGFEHGDIQFPFVLGGLWNGKDKPPLGENLQDENEGKIKRSGFVSRRGHMLIFFDGPQDTGIALISANKKYRISLNETKNELHVVAGGKLKIEAQELEIAVAGGATIKASSGMNLEAAGPLKVKGATVAIN